MTAARWLDRRSQIHRSFATGIADAEAFALIDKMIEIYPFPKERALEYLDLSRYPATRP